MQRESSVVILWDASHIWGLMAWRALRALGVPSRLVKAKEIAQGALHGKPGQAAPGLLLVPGGSAGRKAALLGRPGREAVRDFVRRGGAYLGFCGGAGLALSHEQEEQGLGLCPWTRAPYELRFQHLVSGHVLAHASGAATGDGGLLSLPVWWPGRFAPHKDMAEVAILATGLAPDEDLWLADLPLAGLSPRVLETWRVCYGVDLSPDFLAGQPLVVSGKYGQGTYLLSYSHLETPESPAANAWLVRILEGLGIAVSAPGAVPAWELDAVTPARGAGDTVPQLADDVGRARARILALIALGVEQRLFFRRTPWLRGWRSGLPGMTFNNLAAAFSELEALTQRENLGPAGAAARDLLEQLWVHLGPRLAGQLPVFAEGAESWLMASRLADLLAPTLPDTVDARGLAHQRAALFGHPMHGGGLAEELLQIAEEGIFAAQALAGEA